MLRWIWRSGVPWRNSSGGGAVAGLGPGLSGIRLAAAMAGSGLFGVLIVVLKLLAH